jgi:hypothetical protein
MLLTRLPHDPGDHTNHALKVGSSPAMSVVLVALFTTSAAFGRHGARSLPVRHRVSPPVACANEGLIGTMCAFETDDERQAAMKAVFAKWPAGSHDSKGDDLVAAISKRIGETQAAALAAHGRGEDTVGRRVESAVLAVPQLATCLWGLALALAGSTQPGGAAAPLRAQREAEARTLASTKVRRFHTRRQPRSS